MARSFPSCRRLCCEALEDRRMLTTFLVTNLDDSGAGSLRQAILDANDLPGADTVDLTGVSGTIAVTLGEMQITDELTIEGPGAEEVTIDAQHDSRIFNILATTGDFSISRLSLTGGRTTSPSSGGGAIGSLTSGTLTITASDISDNSTQGNFSEGGGIYASGNVTVTNSTVSGNSTLGLGADGGGIYADGAVTITNSTINENSTEGDSANAGGIHSYNAATVTNSTVSGNSTTGDFAYGGGITAFGHVTVFNSTISGNSTTGERSYGGGIFGDGFVTVTNSTVSGNSTTGDLASGGGIYAKALTVTDSTVSGNSTTGNGADGGGILTAFTDFSGIKTTVTNSTVSGNSTSGDFARGGGIFSTDGVTVTHSTITDNHVFAATSTGGGIFNPVVIHHSIVADNTAGGGMPDVDSGTGTFDVDFSVIGDTTGLVIVGVGNVLDVDPLLGPLAENGGPTKTHALLAGSAAIDAGDPAIGFDPGEFDQRGAPFVRVADGGVDGLRIDMGALESQPVVVDGDFNDDGLYDCLDIDALVAEIAAQTNGLAFDLTGDGQVDLADRDAWLAEAGEINLGPGKVYLLGDATLDGLVDGLDFIEWNENKFTSVAAWSAGDFTADGLVDGLDFILWNENKFQSSDGLTQIVLPRSSSVLHEITRNNHVDSDTEIAMVEASNVIPQIAAPMAQRVDAIFATRASEDHTAERPIAKSFDNFDDDLPTLRPLIVS